MTHSAQRQGNVYDAQKRSGQCKNCRIILRTGHLNRQKAEKIWFNYLKSNDCIAYEVTSLDLLSEKCDVAVEFIGLVVQWLVRTTA